jgi:hypothetical protein
MILISFIGVIRYETYDERLVVYILPHTKLVLDPKLSMKENYEQKAKPVLNSVLSALDYDYRYKFNWAEV